MLLLSKIASKLRETYIYIIFIKKERIGFFVIKGCLI